MPRTEISESSRTALTPTQPSPFQGEEWLPVQQFRMHAPMVIARAKGLRREMTKMEKRLWYALARKQLGHYFRRQHPIGSYIVDFVCIEKKLIIELDGGQHASRISYDAKRTVYLESKGYTVLRFWNSDVMENREGVLLRITEWLARGAKE